MSRKNESFPKTAMREIMKNYLKGTNTNIRDGVDVKNIMRDMMSVLLDGVLDGEMDESYSSYEIVM